MSTTSATFAVVLLLGIAATTATQFDAVLARARNGLHQTRRALREQRAASHTMKTLEGNFAPQATEACQAFATNLSTQCGDWYDSKNNITNNWVDFCANDCLSLVKNNTDCLASIPDMAGIVPQIPLFDALCRRDGPGRTPCGNVYNNVQKSGQCESYGYSDCLSDTDCSWDDQNSQCSVALSNTFLDDVCSPCLQGLGIALAELASAGSGSGSGTAGQLDNFRNLLCLQQGDSYCALTVANINLTTSAQVAAACAASNTTGCLRKYLPAVSAMNEADQVKGLKQCVAQYAEESDASFHTSVETYCLPCYEQKRKDARQAEQYVNNLCLRNSDSKFCLSFFMQDPPAEVQECYFATSEASSCNATCNTVMTAFVDSFGCCWGLFNTFKNDTLPADELQHFWNLVQKFSGRTPAPPTPAPPVPATPAPPSPPTPPTPAPPSPPTPPTPPTPAPPSPPTPPTPPTPAPPSPPTPAPPAPATPAPATPAPTTPAPATPAPTTPAPATPAPTTPAPATPAPTTPAPAPVRRVVSPDGPGNGGCSGGGDGPDFGILALCSGLSNLKQRSAQVCAMERSGVKKVRALKMKLNCTAVNADATIKAAILAAMVKDIASALGIDPASLTDVQFVCTDAARRAASGNALLQFAIQTDSDANTNAADAMLTEHLSQGTLTFPTLTNTVETLCTTCATSADLLNLAEVSDTTLAPTTSSSSALTLVTAAILVLVTALMA